MLREIRNIGKYSTRPGFTLVELIMVAAMMALVTGALTVETTTEDLSAETDGLMENILANN